MFLAREQRVRRWWLGFLIYQFFIWNPFSLWFLQAHRLQPVHPALFFGMIFFFELILFLITFHCAYRKMGTKLITFWLITSPMLTIYGFVDETMIELVKYHPFGLLYLVVNFGQIVVAYLLTLKLRRINQRLQLRKFMATEAYQSALQSISVATDLADLEAKCRRMRGPTLFMGVVEERRIEMAKRWS